MVAVVEGRWLCKPSGTYGNSGDLSPPPPHLLFWRFSNTILIGRGHCLFKWIFTIDIFILGIKLNQWNICLTSILSDFVSFLKSLVNYDCAHHLVLSPISLKIFHRACGGGGGFFSLWQRTILGYGTPFRPPKLAHIENLTGLSHAFGEKSRSSRCARAMRTLWIETVKLFKNSLSIDLRKW